MLTTSVTWSITRPNCALDRRTILCLYVLGSQNWVFKHVRKCRWIPLTKVPCIPRTYECNVNVVGTFVLSRIPQQANIASCFGFRKCWAVSAKCKWNPQLVSGFRILIKTHQLKARAGILKQVFKFWLLKSLDVIL